ncbi:MAG: hypothetical protein IJV04_01500 [Lachnospiraceae bacterium]|nr:hypothetical protein [Lachnospiraceae bacterium]
MIAFSWQDNWMAMDVCHAMTDGTGAYEILRTLMYYYCTERYSSAYFFIGQPWDWDE